MIPRVPLCETRRRDMYRVTILFIAAAAAAPQDNSITYIKTLPVPGEPFPVPGESLPVPREPLPVPREPLPVPREPLPVPGEPLPAPSYTASYFENQPLSSQDASDYRTEEDISSKQEYLDVSADSSKHHQTTDSTEDSTEESTDASEGTTATERYEPKTTPKVKKAPPRFYSKLSYFEKPRSDSVVANLVERSGKRKFRSNCRCEKISNCPKLQITVPRCPEEYFLCCF